MQIILQTGEKADKDKAFESIASGFATLKGIIDSVENNLMQSELDFEDNLREIQIIFAKMIGDKFFNASAKPITFTEVDLTNLETSHDLLSHAYSLAVKNPKFSNYQQKHKLDGFYAHWNEHKYRYQYEIIYKSERFWLKNVKQYDDDCILSLEGCTFYEAEFCKLRNNDLKLILDGNKFDELVTPSGEELENRFKQGTAVIYELIHDVKKCDSFIIAFETAIAFDHQQVTQNKEINGNLFCSILNRVFVVMNFITSQITVQDKVEIVKRGGNLNGSDTALNLQRTLNIFQSDAARFLMAINKKIESGNSLSRFELVVLEHVTKILQKIKSMSAPGAKLLTSTNAAMVYNIVGETSENIRYAVSYKNGEFVSNSGLVLTNGTMNAAIEANFDEQNQTVLIMPTKAYNEFVELHESSLITLNCAPKPKQDSFGQLIETIKGSKSEVDIWKALKSELETIISFSRGDMPGNSKEIAIRIGLLVALAVQKNATDFEDAQSKLKIIMEILCSKVFLLHLASDAEADRPYLPLAYFINLISRSLIGGYYSNGSHVHSLHEAIPERFFELVDDSLYISNFMGKEDKRSFSNLYNELNRHIENTDTENKEALQTWSTDNNLESSALNISKRAFIISTIEKTIVERTAGSKNIIGGISKVPQGEGFGEMFRRYI